MSHSTSHWPWSRRLNWNPIVVAVPLAYFVIRVSTSGFTLLRTIGLCVVGIWFALAVLDRLLAHRITDWMYSDDAPPGHAERVAKTSGELALAVDDEGVRLLRGGAIEKQVRWADLVEVGVMTTDDGPLGEDFWLRLIGTDKTGCAVPSEIEGFSGLRDRVFKLPGFDFEKWIEACGSAEKGKCVCWKRSP